MAAASALVVSQYRKAFPAARPQPGPGGPRGLVGRVESTVASSPRLKRTVRELSSRSPAVRRLRIAGVAGPRAPPGTAPRDTGRS